MIVQYNDRITQPQRYTKVTTFTKTNNTGGKDFHCTKDFLPVVVEYLERMIEASYAEIREYVAHVMELTPRDLELINKHNKEVPRYWQHIENLSNSKTMERIGPTHIEKVRGGFFRLNDQYLDRITSPS